MTKKIADLIMNNAGLPYFSFPVYNIQSGHDEENKGSPSGDWNTGDKRQETEL